MNYYKAKFEREKKDNPTDWVILPDMMRTGGQVSLVFIAHVSMPDDSLHKGISRTDLRALDYGMMP